MDQKIMEYTGIVSWFCIMIIAMFFGMILQSLGIPIAVILILVIVLSFSVRQAIQITLLRRYNAHLPSVYPISFRIFLGSMLFLVYGYFLLTDQWGLLAYMLFLDVIVFGVARYARKETTMYR